MNTVLKVGSTIRVEVKNFSPMILNPIFKGLVPETLFYEGTVVPNNKWDQPNTFNLTTGDISFPVRNIAMRSVIRIDGSDVVHNDQTLVRTVQVEGSKGNAYTVIIDGDKATCTCPQNQFRKQVCKHIKQVLGHVESSPETETSVKVRHVPESDVHEKRDPSEEASDPRSKIAQAREIFLSVSGRRDRFIDRVQRDLGMTISGANTYFYKIRNE